jgi:hypothetical protein
MRKLAAVGVSVIIWVVGSIALIPEKLRKQAFDRPAAFTETSHGPHNPVFGAR